MKSRAVGRFWRLYDGLPTEIRRAADKQFVAPTELYALNPQQSTIHLCIRASHRKKFQLALRPHSACHNAEALERVRGKTP